MNRCGEALFALFLANSKAGGLCPVRQTSSVYVTPGNGESKRESPKKITTAHPIEIWHFRFAANTIMLRTPE
jgi:hypothetical protein